jgi:nuclear receptor subfamily 1 group I
MKKEYIMSDEDKELKRIKIEQNRNKRKLKGECDKSSGDEQDHLHSKKSQKIKEEWSPRSISSLQAMDTHGSDGDESEEGHVPERLYNTTIDSTATEIVEAITKVPQDASQVLQKLLKTQHDTLFVMSKIIQDPSQALILISHLIKNPSDGMLIISKMMSSPIDALTVFTQFMSSPTDALQIIFKIISSPKDVLQFMTELTKAPQDALEIMGRFMASPGDTLAGINRMIIKAAAPAEIESNEAIPREKPSDVIKTMLDATPVNSPTNSSIASPSSSFQSVRTENSPQSVPSSSNADYDSNNNTSATNGDYQQNTAKLLNEITQDTSEKETNFHANSIDSIINEAIKLEYDTPQMISHMRSTNRELNEVEIMKIQELIESNKSLYAYVSHLVTPNY